jgi:regulatory protein
LYYLQRYAASSSHFRRVMMRKVDKSCQFHKDQEREACAALVDALVEKFVRAGLLDDQSYLRGSINSMRRRGLSGRAIEAKLAAKGIAQSVVKTALQADETEKGQMNADLIAALRLARKKRFGAFARPDGETPPEKAMAAMARAGFDYETARKALGMPREDAETLLGL